MATRNKSNGGNRARNPDQRTKRTAMAGNREESESTENPLHKAFLDEIADIYNAEQQLTKALPRMAKAAESEELREAFELFKENLEEEQAADETLTTMAESLANVRAEMSEKEPD